MTSRITIFIALILTVCSSVGQIDNSAKTFFKHQQTCHVIGTTETDYLIQLTSNSFFKLVIYSASYVDQYSSALRQVYEGKFFIKGDTLILDYYNRSSSSTNKSPFLSNNTQNKMAGLLGLNPGARFIMKEESLSPINQLLPTFLMSSSAKAEELNAWYNSLDRRTRAGKGIIGMR